MQQEGRVNALHISYYPEMSTDSDGDPDSKLPKIPATFRNALQRNAYKPLDLERIDHADRKVRNTSFL